MRCGPACRLGLVLIALLVSLPPSDAGNGQVLFVPWKVVEPGAAPSSSTLTLYWIPTSPDEMRKSDFITSRTLALFAARCVSMQVIRADDLDRLEKLGAARDLPLALVVENDQVVARVAHNSGTLRLQDVESTIRQAVDEREFVCDALLDAAREKIAAGDSAAAIENYRRVWNQRCAFPRQGREAQKALKRMRALQ